MATARSHTDTELFEQLNKRSRELECYYAISSWLQRENSNLEKFLEHVIKTVPKGWMYPEVCKVKIELGAFIYHSDGYAGSTEILSEPIIVLNERVGIVRVAYMPEVGKLHPDPFISEEITLLQSVTHLIRDFLIKNDLVEDILLKHTISYHSNDYWKVTVRSLQDFDQDLHQRFIRKTLVDLCEKNLISEKQLANLIGRLDDTKSTKRTDHYNADHIKRHDIVLHEAFDLISSHLSRDDILVRFQQCMRQEKYGTYIRKVILPECSVRDIIDVIKYFHDHKDNNNDLPDLLVEGILVQVTRLLLSDQLEFIKASKPYIRFEHFNSLVDHMISPPGSHGKIGNKAAKTLLASCMLQKSQNKQVCKVPVKVPTTWYITSDGLYHFLQFNDLLEELSEHKYKDINRIQIEYPYVRDLVFKAHPPQWLVSALSYTLENMNDSPLIVRSSSLLEDRIGLKFSGLYDYCLLPNSGTKTEQLKNLLRAVIEVYISTFGPAPLQYRAEHGLTDFSEEMGIIIQKVVGVRAEKFYFPFFSGRISIQGKRRRSTDRNSERVTISIFPGLRPEKLNTNNRGIELSLDTDQMAGGGSEMNWSAEESIWDNFRYLNLSTGKIEQRSIDALLDESDTIRPYYHIMKKILDNNLDYTKVWEQSKGSSITKPTGKLIFQLKSIICKLYDLLQTPLDIDYAFDGENIYLLKCSIDFRLQS